MYVNYFPTFPSIVTQPRVPQIATFIWHKNMQKHQYGIFISRHVGARNRYRFRVLSMPLGWRNCLLKSHVHTKLRIGYIHRSISINCSSDQTL